MKFIVLACFLLSACTVTKSTLDSGPKFKVGDNFSTDREFYLGKGTLRVTAAFYGACFGVSKALQWVYLGELKTANGSVIDDVQICESDLK